MNSFEKMQRRLTSSSSYNKLQRFVLPLKEQLDINHFWYYTLSNSGEYSYIGTHQEWNSYCFNNGLVSDFLCLRAPQTQQLGLNLMKNTQSTSYKNAIKIAWNNFHINFCFNMVRPARDGIEAYGFATLKDHPAVENRLLNEISVLNKFQDIFKLRFKNLIEKVKEDQVNLYEYMGPIFNTNSEKKADSWNRSHFVQRLGIPLNFKLTLLEKKILRYTVNGYPASYISASLHRSQRTVENYIVKIKDKLNCQSKLELIQKAIELNELGIL